ncbi:MAG TPA: hypothetical protein VHC18_16380 [Amycolatopsis sp.]|nr:hypothetical protein [Amycolatopsis sp.]
MSKIELTDAQRRLRERFMNERSDWNPFWNGLRALDPAFFEAYLSFSGAPWCNRPAGVEGQGTDLHRHRRLDHAPR